MKKFLEIVGGITCVSVIFTIVLVAISIITSGDDEYVEYIDPKDVDFPELDPMNE